MTNSGSIKRQPRRQAVERSNSVYFSAGHSYLGKINSLHLHERRCLINPFINLDKLFILKLVTGIKKRERYLALVFFF